MVTKDILSIWAEACKENDIAWFLGRETLLCGECYEDFPETHTCTNVMVFAGDVRSVVEKVFPKYSGSLELTKKFFLTGKKFLCLSQGEPAVPVLIVDIITPNESDEDMESSLAAVKAVRAETTKVYRRGKIIGALFGEKVGGLYKNGKTKATESNFKEMVALAEKLGAKENCSYYCLPFTDPAFYPVERSYFDETAYISCGGVEYPVFGGYKAYLREKFGDYEEGLFDHIGVGLTNEEKVDLAEHQKHCTQALKFIEEISREFGLRYYLLAGSVLGAVRHKGFIPWDDDIDLGIRIEDLKHFEEVVARELPKRLPEQFSLIQPAPDFDYPRMFSKICYEGRCCMDLWPLVPTWVDGVRAKLKWAFAKIITKVHYKKIGYAPTRFVKPVNLACKFMNDRMAMWFARLNEKISARKPRAYINLYSIYTRPKETILTKWLDTPATDEFEGITIPVVGCTHEYLTHLYGDYMKFPAPWKRASRHVARFGDSEQN